ncbi:unnamed protein product [Wuchereria bancrofti]|uniref:Uncharacterized protein n=2 Tax=Wuchereria bancrofti TaxID=6293 RepID=A0A3P7DK45_WUCBA|nr:unnamed protein product [Wuchereria bancrofti]
MEGRSTMNFLKLFVNRNRLELKSKRKDRAPLLLEMSIQDDQKHKFKLQLILAAFEYISLQLQIAIKRDEMLKSPAYFSFFYPKDLIGCGMAKMITAVKAYIIAPRSNAVFITASLNPLFSPLLSLSVNSFIQATFFLNKKLEIMVSRSFDRNSSVKDVDREYPDLCILPELTEQTLLDNLKGRFASGHIYFVNKQSNINETITNKQQTLSALPSAFILLLFSS